MKTDGEPPGRAAAGIAAELEALGRRFLEGDVRTKAYARRRQDLLAALGRAKIAPALEPGEAIVAEHHCIEPFARLPASPLSETAQVACSLYATDRRLFRWRFQDRARPDARPLDGVEERLEFRWYADLAAARTRAVPRWGEAAAGVVIAAAGWFASGHLSITAPVLQGVGVFGILHGLAMPTRAVAFEMRTPGEAVWIMWAARTRSGRALLGVVTSRLGRRAGEPA